jgi:group I intron endonuclease
LISGQTNNLNDRSSMAFTVYMIKNKVSGKIYVGATTKTLEKRYFRGFSKTSSNKSLQRDATILGEESFEISVLFECKSKEEMNFKETEFIISLDSWNPEYGYNSYTGGNAGRKISEHHKERLMSNFKGKRNSGFSHLWCTPEAKEIHRKKLSIAAKRKFEKNGVPEETKKKLSESSKIYWRKVKEGLISRKTTNKGCYCG